MSRMLVLYYSRTGNTERMAAAVARGARAVQGVEVNLSYHIEVEDLPSFEGIAVGIPTYHHDMTVDIKTLFEEAAVRDINLKGKIGAAFGSYGWSGEAPRLVLEILKNRFEMHTVEPSLLVKYSPDEADLENCREFGRRIAEKLFLAP